MVNKFARFSSLLVVAALVAGCEWTSTSSGDSWSDSYNDMNFSGTYRSSSTQTSESGESTVTRSVSNQTVGRISQTTGSFSCGVSDIVAGSMTIKVGDVTFSDDGAGRLVGSDGNSSGSIAYSSGSGSISMQGGYGNAYAGQSIVASYSWSTTSSNSGSTSGNTITAITVSQSGQKLTLRCNNGYTLSGRFTTVNRIGTIIEGVSSRYNAQFEVSGSGAKMVGTLHHNDSSRSLNGTLTDRSGTYDISGTAAGL